MIPDNWIWWYGKHCFFSMSSVKPSGETFDYIDIDSINNRKQLITNPKKIKVSEAPSRATRKLDTGDTLFSMVRPYLLNIAFVSEKYKNCIASTGFYVYKPMPFITNPMFLFYLLQSPYVINGLMQYMKGDNSPSINGGNIESFMYPMPPLNEQVIIANRLTDLLVKLELLY